MAKHNAPHRKSAKTATEGLRNQILLALPADESTLLLSKLSLVNLPLNEVLQRVGEPIDFVHFPNSLMTSVLTLMEDGKGIEVGLVGNEGFVGLAAFAGYRTSSHRMVVQSAGTSYRMPTRDFQKLLPLCPALNKGLIRFAQQRILQASQVSACNRLHEVEHRLARWLLMTHDRVGIPQLPLTQEFLGQMLGTRRVSVSLAASVLQKAGLISYVHGHITILNRDGLEKVSCECYRVLNEQLHQWRAEVSS